MKNISYIFEKFPPLLVCAIQSKGARNKTKCPCLVISLKSIQKRKLQKIYLSYQQLNKFEIKKITWHSCCRIKCSQKMHSSDLLIQAKLIEHIIPTRFAIHSVLRVWIVRIPLMWWRWRFLPHFLVVPIFINYLLITIRRFGWTRRHGTEPLSPYGALKNKTFLFLKYLKKIF